MSGICPDGLQDEGDAPPWNLRECFSDTQIRSIQHTVRLCSVREPFGTIHFEIWDVLNLS
jgi:hypothetical protein